MSNINKFWFGSDSLALSAAFALVFLAALSISSGNTSAGAAILSEYSRVEVDLFRPVPIHSRCAQPKHRVWSLTNLTSGLFSASMFICPQQNNIQTVQTLATASQQSTH